MQKYNLSEEKSYEESKSEIYSLLSTVKSSNSTLLDHLTKLFQVKLSMENDEKFLDLFEDISLRIRHEEKYLQESSRIINARKYIEAFLSNSQGNKTLLEPLVKKDGDDIVPVTQVGFVPDYYSIFQDLEWCGIAIGAKESYLLTSSLKTLASERTLPNVRFWGKIYGIEKDYFIAESTGATDGGKYDSHRKRKGA